MDKDTPTMVAYPSLKQDSERMFGKIAANQMSRNLKSTYPYFTRLLGLKNAESHMD